MNAKQKNLLCAASDLLSNLSSGQLRSLTNRKNPYRHSVCVSPSDLRNLFDAVEAIYPGLVKNAHAISVESRRKAIEKIRIEKGWVQ